MRRQRAARTFVAVKDAYDPVPALKQQLARAILDRFRGTGQFSLAWRLGVDLPRVSNLERGRLERFSLQQLVRFATRGGAEVAITVTWPGSRAWLIPRGPARARAPCDARP